MSLVLMLESPHSVDLLPQMADWLKLLQDLGEMDIYRIDVKKTKISIHYLTFNIYV